MSNLSQVDSYSNGLIFASIVGLSAITALFMHYHRTVAPLPSESMQKRKVTHSKERVLIAHASGLFDLALKGSKRGWKEMFAHYSKLLPLDCVLKRQYEAFAIDQVPTNSDPKIHAIEIHENHDELIDIRQMDCERIKMLPDPTRPFESPFLNSGLPNASKMRLGLFMKLMRMVEMIDELAYDFEYSPGQIEIRIFEGLRDVETQQQLYDNKLAEVQLANSHFTVEQAEKEASKWVTSPKKCLPVHATGAAVDLSLWDSINEKILDMGTLGAIWGKNESAPTFSENITDRQKRNRLFLALTAERAELTNYPYEFWHFSSADRCDAYWRRTKALYGPIFV